MTPAEVLTRVVLPVGVVCFLAGMAFLWAFLTFLWAFLTRTAGPGAGRRSV